LKQVVRIGSYKGYDKDYGSAEEIKLRYVSKWSVTLRVYLPKPYMPFLLSLYTYDTPPPSQSRWICSPKYSRVSFYDGVTFSNIWL